MKSVRMVTAVLLCCLASGVVSAENNAQQKAESDAQPKVKKGVQTQSKKGGQPRVKGAQTKTKKSVQKKTAAFIMPKNYKIRKIKADIRKEFDTPEARDICSGFIFSEPEVREYFKKANVISEHVRQYGYQTLPCYVGGEMLMNNEVALWEIEASSAGKILFKSGRVVNFGCRDACREIFDKK